MTTALGIISDTHGLLRPEAIKALQGVDRIVHAGDIGGAEILRDLRLIAPVDAVRGNNDKGDWADSLPAFLALEFGVIRIHVLHDLKELDIDPQAAGFAMVISGHSHQPRVVQRDGVQFINPGSAGPRRFSLPVTVVRVQVTSGAARARIIDIL